MNVERRVEKAEERLNMDRPPTVMQIVMFGGEPLPPEERQGNVTVQYVAYETIRGRLEGATE